MSTFAEKYFYSRDGLKLCYRDYAGDPSKVPVLYLPGLTRTGADFERNAEHIAPARRVITTDQRGRGHSQRDWNWLNYHQGMYVDDMWMLLRELKLPRVIVVGTSLGGVMAMMMATMRTHALAGVVLNDIGPELDLAGAQRIQAYVCKRPQIDSWDDAVAHVKETFGGAYPDLTEERWREFARHSFWEDPEGRLQPVYDPKIAELLRWLPYGAMPPMWFAYSALRRVPTLAIRGEISDLLSVRVFERMKRDKPDLVQLTVPNRGHAPLLHEPLCAQAIEAFIAHVDP